MLRLSNRRTKYWQRDTNMNPTAAEIQALFDADTVLQNIAVEEKRFLKREAARIAGVREEIKLGMAELAKLKAARNIAANAVRNKSTSLKWKRHHARIKRHKLLPFQRRMIARQGFIRRQAVRRAQTQFTRDLNKAWFATQLQRPQDKT